VRQTGVGAGVQRQRSDDVAVEQRGEFGHRSIHAHHPGAVDEDTIVEHLQAIRTALRQLRGERGEASERRLNCGWAPG
jgi:hypothetical protein